MADEDKYLDKHLLIGLTYRNEQGEIVKQEQLHGRITRITPLWMFMERADGQGEFKLPWNPDHLKPAEPGEYELKSTGEVVVDPDFLTTWTLHAGTPDLG